MSSTLTDRNPEIFSNEYTPPDKIDFDNIMCCARADSMRDTPHAKNPHARIAAKFRVSRNALAIGKAALYHTPADTRYPSGRLPAESDTDTEALIIPLTGMKRVPRMGHHLDTATGKWCEDQYEHTLVSPLTTTGVHVVPLDGSPSHTVGSGILQPFDWDELPGIVVVTQNPLDALALWTVGICAVAVPNAGTGLETLLNVIHFYRKEEGFDGLDDTLKKRGWFWADAAGASLSAWASINAGAMKSAGIKGVELSWWTTCPVGDWVRDRVPAVTSGQDLVDLGNTLAAIIEDNSSDSGDMPESPTIIDSPPKCVTLPLESLAALVPDADYRRCLSDAARSRRELYPMERLAAEEASLAADSGDVAEYRHWMRVGLWATIAETEQDENDHLTGPRTVVADEMGSLPYVVLGNKICRRNVDDDGTVKDTVYCNFDARITAEILRDDGTETTTVFELQGVLCDGTPLPPIQVPVDEFDELKWVTKGWFSGPNIYVEHAANGHVRVAIKYLSQPVPRRTNYTHTGWRKIGGRWVYLTAGGGISGTGIVPDVAVDFERNNLGNYKLPKPPEPSKRAGYVRSSLALLDGLAPNRVMYPLYSAMACAIFGETQTIVALNGNTGSYKSEIAALIQQHWGSGMTRPKLPGSWRSTANYLEIQGHHSKDSVLVVDDFLAGNGAEANKMHDKAENFLRGVGNCSARGRLNQDATAKASRPAQCLVITTGECSPRGPSLQARMMQLDLERKMVDLKRLKTCQKDAASGKYSSAMAGFVEWVAPQYEILKKWFTDQIEIQRDLYTKSGQHARMGTQVGTLITGLMCWLEFAQYCGAVTPDEVKLHLERADISMSEAAVLQSNDQQSEDPSGKFLRLLAASIASGHSHLASMDGNEPSGENAGRWGWRSGYPQGNLVGWVDGTDLYLEPDSSYAAACSLAKTQNDGFQIGRRDLNKRLETAGFLVRTDKRQATVRVMLDGTRRNVLCLKVGSLAGEKPTDVEAGELFESL